MLFKDELRGAGLGSGGSTLHSQGEGGTQRRSYERLKTLLDPGSFVALGQDIQAGKRLQESSIGVDNVAVGWGKINGRIVYVFAHDCSALGGAIGESSSRKILRVLDLAIKNGTPIVGLHESVGIQLEEGISSLVGMAKILHKSAMASGVIPQISIVTGPCAGTAAHHPVMSDFVIMLEGPSTMFLCGPDAVKEASGEKVTSNDLGGASVQSQSGVAHLVARTEEECFQLVRRLFAYLPSNNLDDPPQIATRDDCAPDNSMLDSFAAEPDSQYDMIDVLRSIVDDGELLQIQSTWAKNVVTTFGRLNSRSIGIIASQPKELGGALDTIGCTKAARFIRFCDAFNLPLVIFVDCPGILPAVEEEKGGVARHSSKLLYAFCEATVPKISVITRKAYGEAYLLMCNEHVSDIRLAWPSATISVMGPIGMVKAMFASEISRSENPESRIKDLVREYIERFADPRFAASKGYIDKVVVPRDTRKWLILGLESLSAKRESRPQRKHGAFF